MANSPKRAAARRWSLQDAKNKLSAVVDAAEKGTPQIVTRRGVETAVVISWRDYERLTGAPRTSFVEHLLNIPVAGEGEDDIERIDLGLRHEDL